MIKNFNCLKEIHKYYDEKTNTYNFKEGNLYIDYVIFNFDLYVDANINALNIIGQDINAKNITAWDIKANDITAWNIKAYDIKAMDIKADDIEANDINVWENITAESISYFAVCFAYGNIKCKKIKGEREGSKHFVLSGKIEIENIEGEEDNHE